MRGLDLRTATIGKSNMVFFASRPPKWYFAKFGFLWAANRPIALGSFSEGSFSIIAIFATIEKDPYEKDPNGIPNNNFASASTRWASSV